MGLQGKRVCQFEIKSSGDLFHDVFLNTPHHISTMSPATIRNCQLHEGGELGTVGSVLFWNFFHDGKDMVSKSLIQDVNEEKKTITFKVLEGDLVEQYKTFTIILQVETVGENDLVTWTYEYEKHKDEDPDPDTLMDFHKNLTKDIENHHLQQKLN